MKTNEEIKNECGYELNEESIEISINKFKKDIEKLYPNGLEWKKVETNTENNKRKLKIEFLLDEYLVKNFNNPKIQEIIVNDFINTINKKRIDENL